MSNSVIKETKKFVRKTVKEFDTDKIAVGDCVKLHNDVIEHYAFADVPKLTHGVTYMRNTFTVGVVAFVSSDYLHLKFTDKEGTRLVPEDLTPMYRLEVIARGIAE